MSVQFIVGRAGTGKTVRTLERIESACRDNPLGRPIWLIVPRQATFEYERALLCRLGAFVRVRIVSMESLGEAVLAEVGGIAMPQVSAAGRRMVIGRLLWRHHEELKYFASSARRPGLAASVDALFDDFERSGQSLDQLGDLIDRFGHAGNTPSLHAKLTDLRLLYGHYQQYLGQDRLDPEKRRQEIAQRLRRAESLLHAQVYVDAFYEFTENERRILAEVAGVAERLEINLTLPADSAVLNDPRSLPDEMSAFHRTQTAYQRLFQTLQKSGAAIDAPVRLMETRRFKSPALAAVEAKLWADGGSSAGGASASAVSAVDFIEAADARAEVQRVAACIQDLIRTEGFRRREVLVLVRKMDDYQHLIHAAFAEHGIPYFADRRRLASHHPLIRFVRAVVWIARDRWSPAAVIALAKTELAGLTQPEADRLENHIREYGITASAWLNEVSLGYSRPDVAGDEEFDITASPADALSAAGGDVHPAVTTLPPTGRELDAIRTHLQQRLHPLIEMLGRGARPATLNDFATALGRTLEAFEVRQSLEQWIAAEMLRNPELAGEHEQVWSQLQSLLQEMVEVLGTESMRPAEFVEVLESGLDGFDLALTPPTLDQVLVGSVDRTRSLGAKVVFLLGLSRGIFPATFREDSLLSGQERRELHRHQVDVDPDPSRQQLDERFLAYIALTRGSHRLVVSRPEASPSGNRLDPSEFWHALRRIVPDAPVERCQSSPLEQISTPRALVGSLLGWARGLQDSRADAASPQANDWRRPLYDWLASNPHKPPLEHLVQLAWPSLIYSNRPELSDPVTRQLFAPPLTFSAGQLESFASCPFQHFAAYGLKLGGRGSSNVGPMELSRIYHDVLQRVVDTTLSRNQNIAELAPDQIAWLVRDWIQPVARQLHDGRFLAEARGQYIVQRVERMLEMIFGTMCEQLRRGTWKPMRAGVPFGTEKAKLKSPPIPLPDGSVAQLRGQIDRIDHTPDGGLAVYDYRLSDQRLSISTVFHGLALRLLASMMVLERASLSLRGTPLTPVAGLSAALRRSLQDKDHPSEAADPASPEFKLAAKPRGVIRDTHARAFDRETEAAQSPVVQVYYKKDGTFGKRDTTDIAEADELRLLLDFVEHKVVELASQITIGRIDVAPYWFEEQSPCPRCSFLSVCRFETPVNRYRKLESMKREPALERMKEVLATSPAPRGTQS